MRLLVRIVVLLAALAAIAAAGMYLHLRRSLPVLEGDQLAGMITDRDIVVRAIAQGKDPRGMPVREVASRELVTVNADDDLSNALEKMESQQVRRLPVVDEENRLVGVLAQADVALEVKEKAVGEMVEEISKSPTGPRL